MGTAFSKWNKLFDNKNGIIAHQKTEYHAESVERANNFVYQMKSIFYLINLIIFPPVDPGQSIDALWSTANKERIEKNRSLLKPIVESVVYLAKCVLAFRGHRDSGIIQCPDSIEKLRGNKGLFYIIKSKLNIINI